MVARVTSSVPRFTPRSEQESAKPAEENTPPTSSWVTGPSAVGKKVPPLSPDAVAVLRSWLKRGDQARELSGAPLVNELGTAMLLQPNHFPKSREDIDAFRAGDWEYFRGGHRLAIAPVLDSIREISGGSQRVRVAALPVLLTHNKSHTTVQLPLFRVDDANGRTLGYVDNLGRQYASLDVWRAENVLPAGTLTYPAEGHLTEAVDGMPRVVREPSHAVVDTTKEKVVDWAERVATYAGFIVGGAALLGVGGIAVPIAGAALAIGYGGKAVASLVDAVRHGQSINPVKSSQARADWLSAAASFTGLGATGATAAAQSASRSGLVRTIGRLAPAMDVVSTTAKVAEVSNRGYALTKGWSRMGWKERLYSSAQLAFFGAYAARGGGLKKPYSLDSISQELGVPLEAEPSEQRSR